MSDESRTQSILGEPSYNPAAHLERIREMFLTHPFKDDAAVYDHTLKIISSILKQFGATPSDDMCATLCAFAHDLFCENELYYPPTPLTELPQPRHVLEAYEELYSAARLELAEQAMREFLGVFIKALPEGAWSDFNTSTTIPLAAAIQQAPVFIQYAAFKTAFAEDRGGQFLFPITQSKIRANINVASGNSPDDANPRKIIGPLESALSVQLLAPAYLADTPFLQLFECPVPFVIPDQIRFEHTQILGGSGAGKTTLIQQIVLDDLAKPDPPAMVIIDPKGLLVERIQKLVAFDPNGGRLKDRLVIIDPTQSPPPALNMFHPATKWNRMYSDAVRRQIENQAISNFAYVFSSVGSKLTDKQSVPFTFLVRLLFTVPDATILTLLQLLDDPAPSLRQSSFAPHIARLDAISQGFFENEYYDRNFGNTRKEIKARLYSILMRPEFVDMFSAPERKLDMFDCLQSRKIVLVNTAMNALGRESSALLGRYIIALALNAAFERSAIPREKWNPAFLIIDEFQEFADEQKTPELLRLAREYNLGVVIAHQQMYSAEFSDDLRNAISTNTSTKYAAAVEAKDLSYVARDLRCEDDFLQSQKRTTTHAHFACFVRNFTDHAVSISVPLGNIGPDQQMNEADHQDILRRNAVMLSGPLPNPPSPAPRPNSNLRESSAAPETSPASGNHSDIPEAGSTW
jgi:hypothetical protein